MKASGFLLDVTRLVSRVGKGALTGIDRVELAYMVRLAEEPRPVWGLLRTRLGLLLLPQASLRMILSWMTGETLPGGTDFWSMIAHGSNPKRAQVESALRRMAIARLPVFAAGRMLKRRLPPGVVYLNVGHSNIDGGLFSKMRKDAGIFCAVMLHDCIPAEHPEFAAPGQAAAFLAKLAVISSEADLVIHTAAATRETNEGFLAQQGRVPKGIVAPLGISVPEANAAALPFAMEVDAPYFVTIGTLEPRKNHHLLLDVWEQAAAEGKALPPLYLVGNRGWADDGLFRRLQAGVAGVRHVEGLSDAAVAALISGATALLFPSKAEGFGLPAFEAALLGTPVVASDLPVLREFLEDFPVYLDSSDRYCWSEAILDQVLRARRGGVKRAIPDLPTWDAHWNAVLTCL